MNNTILSMALMLAPLAVARADDTRDVKMHQETDADHSKSKVESKQTTDTGGMFDKTTDERKSETDVKRDAKTGHTVSTTEQTSEHKGHGDKHKTTKKTTTERDAEGNVVNSETHNDSK